MKRLAALAVLLLGLIPAAVCQEGGILPRWEVVELAEGLEEQAAKVKTLLGNVDPSKWEGAAPAYVQQLESIDRDLDNLTLSSQALARKPETLSVVVDTFLWLDRVQSMMGSMTDGVRRYQSSALADLMESSRGKHVKALEDLKEYMRQLAVASEDRLAIAHQEAQRCRAQLMKGGR